VYEGALGVLSGEESSRWVVLRDVITSNKGTLKMMLEVWRTADKQELCGRHSLDCGSVSFHAGEEADALFQVDLSATLAGEQCAQYLFRGDTTETRDRWANLLR
jgi:hypothetical protein